MWRILIADDDVEILDYLSNIIPWKENGMEICAKARNGSEALEILKTGQVDILLTDITMPGLNGLDLIKTAKSYQKDLKTLILTCHENFTYAQNAIDLGVCGYLVKYMLEPDSLLKILKNITEKMSHEKEQRFKIKGIIREAERNRELFVEKKLGELLQGSPVLTEEVSRVAQTLGIDENQMMIAALFFREKAEAAIQEKSILLYAVKNIMAEVMENDPVSDPYACDQELIVLFFRKQPDRKKITEAFRTVEKQIKKLLRIEVTIVLSMPHNRLEEFNKLIERLENCRKQHFYSEEMSVIWESDGMEALGSQKPESSRLTEKIHGGDVEGISEELNIIFEFFRENRTAPYIVKAFCLDFVRELEAYLYHQGISDLFEMKEANSWVGYRRQAQTALLWFRQMLETEQKTEVRDEIRQVMDYVKQNLQEGITCESMAEMVNMNVTYFSKLFKKETGEGFSSYLNRIRTERATMLLQHSNLSIEEITEQVGLSNMHYFYRMYKKQTGKLPGEVRRKR